MIREGIWAESGLADATGWDYWARDLPLSARWGNLLLPPALGGLAVGILRKLSGGFENPKEEERPPSQDNKQQQQQQQSATSSASLSNSNGARSLGPTSTSASSSQQDQPSIRASSSSPGNSEAVTSRLNSNHEASTSGSASHTLWSLPWVMSGSNGLKRRMLKAVRPVLKATAAAVTLGTGNSLGPEGPSVEIGRSTARGMGTVLKSKQRRLLSLVAAGSGAGMAPSIRWANLYIMPFAVWNAASPVEYLTHAVQA